MEAKRNQVTETTTSAASLRARKCATTVVSRRNVAKVFSFVRCTSVKLLHINADLFECSSRSCAENSFTKLICFQEAEHSERPWFFDSVAAGLRPSGPHPRGLAAPGQQELARNKQFGC